MFTSVNTSLPIWPKNSYHSISIVSKIINVHICQHYKFTSSASQASRTCYCVRVMSHQQSYRGNHTSPLLKQMVFRGIHKHIIFILITCVYWGVEGLQILMDITCHASQSCWRGQQTGSNGKCITKAAINDCPNKRAMPACVYHYRW